MHSHPPPLGRQGLLAGSRSSLGILVFLLAHVPLAMAMRQYPEIGLVHALATLGIGLWFTTRNRPERVAYVGAYITGAEVLWRMTHAPIFWESGKYALVALFFIALVMRRDSRIPILPLTYFSLLLVSVLFTSSSMNFQLARKEISFNLSGPLALVASGCFFSQIELSRDMIVRLFSALIGPVVGVASIALISMLTATELSFTTQSNFVTSGGFGPNQVAAALGLGALLGYLCLLEGRASYSLRLLMLVTLVILAAQSVLTFSRAGLYGSVASAMVGSVWLMRTNRGRLTVIIAATGLFMIADYVVFPRLESITSGAVSSRFESTKTTGRDLYAAAELNVWAEHPLLGVGPGGAEPYRHRFLPKARESVASHTEYTRLLAEHGILGFDALLLLLVMVIRNFRRANSAESRMLVTSILVWSLLFMAVNGMRLVAPSFMFGLGFASFFPDVKIALSECRQRSPWTMRSKF